MSTIQLRAARSQLFISLTVMDPPNVPARDLLAKTRKQLEAKGFEVWLLIYDPKTKQLNKQ